MRCLRAHENLDVRVRGDVNIKEEDVRYRTGVLSVLMLSGEIGPTNSWALVKLTR